MESNDPQSKERLRRLAEAAAGANAGATAYSLAVALKDRGCRIPVPTLKHYIENGLPDGDGNRRTRTNATTIAEFFNCTVEYLRSGRGPTTTATSEPATSARPLGYRLLYGLGRTHFISGYLDGAPFNSGRAFVSLLESPVIYNAHWSTGRHSAFLSLESPSEAQTTEFVSQLQAKDFRIGFASVASESRELGGGGSGNLKRYGVVLGERRRTAKLPTAVEDRLSLAKLAKAAYPLVGRTVAELDRLLSEVFDQSQEPQLRTWQEHLVPVPLRKRGAYEVYIFLGLAGGVKSLNDEVGRLIRDDRVEDCFAFDAQEHQWLLHAFFETLGELNLFLDSISGFATSTKLVLSTDVRDSCRGDQAIPTGEHPAATPRGSHRLRQDDSVPHELVCARSAGLILRTKPPFARRVIEDLRRFAAGYSEKLGGVLLHVITGRYDYVVCPRNSCDQFTLAQFATDFCSKNYPYIAEDFLVLEPDGDKGFFSFDGRSDRIGFFVVLIAYDHEKVRNAIRVADEQILELPEPGAGPAWHDTCRRMRHHIYRYASDPSQLAAYIREVVGAGNVRFATVSIILASELL